MRGVIAVGFVGCSSHSGQRTFITNAARKISTVGGSLNDVQELAGHADLGCSGLNGKFTYRCSKRQPRASRTGFISRKGAAFFVSGIAGYRW